MRSLAAVFHPDVEPAAPLVGTAGVAVGQRANCRSRSASSWFPRLSWIHARNLYASGSWVGNSSMCRFISARAFSHSGVGSCVSAIARWPYPMAWSGFSSIARVAS